MSGGCFLNFSDRTFSEFMIKSVGSRRRGSGLVALAKSFHDCGAEVETGLRKTPEYVLEIDQSNTSGIA